MIRLPLNQISTLTKIGRVYSNLEQKHERSPTNEEIAIRLDTHSDDVSNIILKSSHVTSLDSPVLSETKNRLMDVVVNREGKEPDFALNEESLRIEILHLLKSLTRKESKIIKLYYGLDGEKAKTLEEVGVEFKLTRERIRQIKEQALQKLRKNSVSRNLLQYL